MGRDSDKTGPHDGIDDRSPYDDQYGYSTTVEIHQKAFVGEISTKHLAYLEIIGLGGKNKIIELGEGGIIIGRNPECEIQLFAQNVSRRHACIAFYNEEYYIEDLDSTNGTYVNGIDIVKCVLRDHDQIEIGGVKILFNEEKILQKT